MARDPRKTPAKPSQRIRGSAKNPRGSAAKANPGIDLSEAQEKALRKKVREHNAKHPAHKVTIGMLKAAWRRGAGAYSTSHRPGVSRSAWAMARVNAFLYLVRTGCPKNPNYTQDNDLLPKSRRGVAKRCKLVMMG